MRIDWNGHPPIPVWNWKLRRRIKYVQRNHTQCYITSTTDGKHSPTSWHYRKRAVDFGSPDPQNRPEKRAMIGLHKKFGKGFKELLGPADFYIKAGVRYPGTFSGHRDHLHVAK